MRPLFDMNNPPSVSPRSAKQLVQVASHGEVRAETGEADGFLFPPDDLIRSVLDLTLELEKLGVIEIEDPVHHAMIRSIEVVRSRGKIIALAIVGIALVSIGTYLILRFMENRQMSAQQQLGRGMDLYHAQLDPAALDDPYGKGPDPVFRTDEAKYKGASKEFSSVIEKYGSSKAAVIAQYYLGLCQLHLNQKEAADDRLSGKESARETLHGRRKLQRSSGNPGGHDQRSPVRASQRRP